MITLRENETHEQEKRSSASAKCQIRRLQKFQAKARQVNRPNYDPIPSSALVMLAERLLARARRKGFRLETREDAIQVIRSLRPAIPRTIPVHKFIVPRQHKPVLSTCKNCKNPIYFGDAVNTSWNDLLDSHINCPGVL